MKPEEVRELLPWYAAGALEPEQVKRVEALLREDPQLDREVAQWRALQTAVAKVGEDEPAFRPELIEEAHRRIDAYEETRNGTGRVRVARRHEQGAKPLPAAGATLLQRLLGVWDITPLAARVAVAAQFVGLAVLVGVLVTQRPDAGFTTASGAGTQTAGGRRVTVVFQPGRSLGEIEAVLEETGAQIVAGPSGQTSYVLDLGDVDEAQAARALETLRRNQAVVRYAAPIE